MKITNLEMAQATMEIFGGFVCLMLTVIIALNGHERKSWKYLNKMFLVVAGIFFSEACAYIFRGNINAVDIFATRISNFLVFFLNLILNILSIQYIYYILREKGVTPSKNYIYIARISVGINVLILISNVVTSWMYFFDEANYYHRNTGWYVYTFLALVCILTSCIMTLRHRKVVRTQMLVSMLLYEFMPVIAIVLQAFNYGISITNIGIFTAMFIMMLAYLKEWSTTEERKVKERKSLEIIVLFIIMTISMSASIISCILSIDRISMESSKNNSIMLAHMVNDGVENQFIKPIMVSKTVANDYSLKTYIKASEKGKEQKVEQKIATYLKSIKNGFGYENVFAVSDRSKAYYTCKGINKYVDPHKNSHDVWYQEFVQGRKGSDLDVDTDETNDGQLSVFVNTRIKDEHGNYLGVCGVGVKMSAIQSILREYEKKYNIKIDLIDKTGLIQIDSSTSYIEKEYLPHTYLRYVNSEEFYYQDKGESAWMTKYMKDLGWYLVVRNNSPDKFNIMEMITSSVIIFIVGILMMGIAFFVISMREKKISRELLEKRRISETDDMTGLFNRRAYVQDSIKIEESNYASKIILIMIDVNGLKTANDTYGHLAGDELIIGTANAIETAMDNLGRAYRTGGDEFILLLDCGREEMEDMIHTLDHIIEKQELSYPEKLSISKGIVIGEEQDNMTLEEMQELADKRMYEDKEKYYAKTGKKRREK